MKHLKKVLSVVIALNILVLIFLPVSAAQTSDAYTITNPYAGVDWETYSQYKTGLHSHTNATDGDDTLKQSIERHAECGFDIVATTDHGTVNYTWETPNDNKFIHTVLSLIGRSEGDLDYLGAEGTFENGTSYTYAKDGDNDYLTLDSGKKILRVNYGIENNAVSVNAHVNSWFVDYHDNTVTTYKDAVKGVDKAGGVCVINHPGEYSKARYEIKPDDAYNTDDYAYWYFINKIAGLIDKYDACIGIDINSKGDDRTRFDRKLWDILLTRFSANGKNVYAICTSDAHQLNKIDTGFTYAVLPEQTNAALENALRKGEFFGASHCIGNPYELAEIAAALLENYGETEVYNNVKTVVDEMNTKIEQVENGTLDADTHLGITYKVLDDKGYFTGNTQPVITSVAVDDDENSITVNTRDALLIRWISDGKLIETTTPENPSFDLDEHSDEIGNYIRAEVFGEGGIVYTNAFILNAEENAGSSNVVDKGFFDFGFLDFLLGELRSLKRILSRKF